MRRVLLAGALVVGCAAIPAMHRVGNGRPRPSSFARANRADPVSTVPTDEVPRPRVKAQGGVTSAGYSPAYSRAANRIVAACRALTDWRALVRCLPWPSSTAFYIIDVQESHGDPNAVNPAVVPACGCHARGLMQILGGPLDAVANIWLGFQMWLARGWEPWAL